MSFGKDIFAHILVIKSATILVLQIYQLRIYNVYVLTYFLFDIFYNINKRLSLFNFITNYMNYFTYIFFLILAFSLIETTKAQDKILLTEAPIPKN